MQTKLTDYQKKRLMQHTWVTDKWILEDIERVLSEPEPPYNPNKNEPVLFTSGGRWHAGVFLGMADTLYLVAYGGLRHRFGKVFPFNGELIGKTTD